MAQDITVTLPDKLYDPIRRMAEATHQPVERLVVSALQASLPSLEGLSTNLAQELVGLELYDNDALLQVMQETVPSNQANEIDRLLQRQQEGIISPVELEQLEELQQNADRTMLRKARAAVLLRFRGQPIPTRSEVGYPGAV